MLNLLQNKLSTLFYEKKESKDLRLSTLNPSIKNQTILIYTPEATTAPITGPTIGTHE
ncbi:hypothetical protein DOK80_001097 [Enterococcus sp. DIV0849a]